VSKAVLRLAIHQICQKFPQVYYFPAYEWITDDLRDYRFFKADMIHPNEQAIAYIWEKFLIYCIDDNAQNFIQKCSKINLMLAHKPFQTNSLAYEKFLSKLEEQIKEINQIKPVFDFKNS
jgi:hypothetical protein